MGVRVLAKGVPTRVECLRPCPVPLWFTSDGVGVTVQHGENREASRYWAYPFDVTEQTRTEFQRWLDDVHRYEARR